MAVSSTFKSAVAARDLLKIRLLMTNELLIDPTFQSFDEMQREVNGMAGLLYVPFDRGALDTDENHWDDHYLGLQQAKLVSNFCPERIAHVQAIIRKLHPAKTMSAMSGSTRGRKPPNDWDTRGGSRSQRPVDYRKQKQADEASGRIIKVVGGGVGGAVIGGLATGVGIVNSSIVTGMGIGAAIGCTIGYLLGEE